MSDKDITPATLDAWIAGTKLESGDTLASQAYLYGRASQARALLGLLIERGGEVAIDAPAWLAELEGVEDCTRA
jgi:hypothetical protein